MRVDIARRKPVSTPSNRCACKRACYVHASCLPPNQNQEIFLHKMFVSDCTAFEVMEQFCIGFISPLYVQHPCNHVREVSHTVPQLFTFSMRLRYVARVISA